jgi:menaquinone-dependent protoporphyrinogen IX oxidase
VLRHGLVLEASCEEAVVARALVAYASGTGCDSACAADIANEIANVPELDVDVRPMGRVRSIEPYGAVYVGWAHPSEPGGRELERFLANNALLLRSRPVWIVHHHPGCSRRSSKWPMRMTRLSVTPQRREARDLVGA